MADRRSSRKSNNADLLHRGGGGAAQSTKNDYQAWHGLVETVGDQWLSIDDESIDPAIQPKTVKLEDSLEMSALVVSITKDVILQNNEKIFFNIGTSSTNNQDGILINADGSVISFTVSGMYRIVFQGEIDQAGQFPVELLIDVTGIDPAQLHFLRTKVKREVQFSTIVPITNRNTLSVRFISIAKLGLKSGAQLQIYRVA